MNTTFDWGRRGAVIGIAVVAAVAVWGISRATGIDLLVKSGSDQRAVGLASVVVVAVLAGLGALAVSASAGRSAHPRRVWLGISVPLLVVSLVGPLGAATVGAGLALASMHILVGAILIVGMGGSLVTAQEGRVR
jgi:hypothetical protein